MEPWAHRRADALTPRQIYERLDAYVIGQERAKRAVAIAAYNHQKRVEARRFGQTPLLKKSNVLLIGPTGSGKTHVARKLAEILSVPFTTVDATEYTEAGYYGKDVEMMVADLLFKARHCVEDAERGIIFIDEVDKIARRTQGARNGAGARDIGGEGVQQALLKMLEGRELFVPTNVGQGFGRQDFVEVDTRDILFICAGTFTDLYDAGLDAKAIGFGAKGPRSGRKAIALEQLESFGMLAEFLGRLPVVVELEPLGEGELVRVLAEPPDAITREYRQLLALDEIEVDFTEDGLRAIAQESLARRLGARGLRSILEQVMGDVMFEAPELRSRRLTVDAPFVRTRLAHPGSGQPIGGSLEA